MAKKSIPIDVVIDSMSKEYPDAHCTLDWNTPLELLIATILAAQCTDARVNQVGKMLFKKYKKPQDYLDVPIEELEQDIRSCGTFHMKAKAIQETCATIIRDYNGEVPRTMKDMLRLRGVGRKTASVVLATAFGILEGIPIDTHNIRLIGRMKLSRAKSQDAIEKDMMKKVPQQYWALFSHWMVHHGRAVCTARNPACEKCVFAHSCPSSQVLAATKQG